MWVKKRFVWKIKKKEKGGEIVGKSLLTNHRTTNPRSKPNLPPNPNRTTLD